MLDLIAKGYNGETPVYLYRLGNYKYEIEKKPTPYFSESEVFDAGYIEAVIIACDEYEIEPNVASKILSQPIIEKIEEVHKQNPNPAP